MGVYVLRRLVLIPPVLMLVSIIAFGIILLLPGDPALATLGEERSHDRVAYEALRNELGLDQPIPVQYVTWAGRALRGDFGVSVLNQQPVGSLVELSLGPTLELSVLSMTIALMVAVPLGILRHHHRSRSCSASGKMVATSST